jgi:hypothetical protein
MVLLAESVALNVTAPAVDVAVSPVKVAGVVTAGPTTWIEPGVPATSVTGIWSVLAFPLLSVASAITADGGAPLAVPE